MKCRVKIILSAVFVWASCTAAFAFGGLTVEEMIERYGINRMDRTIDIRDVALSSLEITNLIPNEYLSPGIKALVGDDSLSSLYKAWEKDKSSLYSISSSSYWDKLFGVSEKDVIGQVMMGFGVSSGSEYTLMKNFDWTGSGTKATDQSRRAIRNYAADSDGETSDYQKYHTGLSVLDINGTLEETAEKIMENSYTESMKEWGPEAAVSSAAALSAVRNQPFADTDSQAASAYAADYTADAAKTKLSKIAEIMSQAEVLKKEANESMLSANEESMKEFAEDSDEFGGEGGAWKAFAAGTGVIARHNLQREALMGSVYKMLALNIRMRNQYFATYMYDYILFTRGRISRRIAEERE